MQVGKAALLMASRGAGVQFAAKRALQEEKVVNRKNFEPVAAIQEVFVNDPGASGKILSTREKREVHNCDVHI